MSSPELVPPSQDAGLGQDRWTMPRWLFRLRGLIAALPLLVVFVWPRAAEAAGRLVPWLGGGLLIGLGCGLRLWAQQHLFYRLKRKKVLATTGPYALLRNPFYVGNAWLCAGAGWACGEVWMALLAGIWVLAWYGLVVRYEEAKLRERYGAPYLEYMQLVPRWLPRRWVPVRGTFLTPLLGEALVKELHCLLIVLLPMARHFLPPLLAG